MCQENKRTYGIELEGYTENNIRGDYVEGWQLISDGSLEDGDGECDYCGGHGERDYECSECWGNGREECSECRGSGEVDCPECHGAGNHECDTCCGGGEVPNEEGDYETCPDCDGVGHHDCEDCDYGEVTCGECDGDGELECNRCEGNGEINEECDECDGRGGYGDGNGYGVECVSNVCTEGDYEPLDKIFNYIERYNWTVNTDCGTHVHIGANDLTPQDLSKLTILMNIIEPIVYGTVSSHRTHTHFCKRTQRDMVQYLITQGENITLQEIANTYYGYTVRLDGNFNKYDSARYYGLNLHSYFYRQTLEFRYFDGTDCKELAQAWIDLCIKLVDFAKHTTFEQLIVIGQDFYKVDDLDLMIGKLETLLGLEYNFRPISNVGFEVGMRNVANQFRVVERLDRAV